MSAWTCDGCGAPDPFDCDDDCPAWAEAIAGGERALVSRRWAEDWDSPEDAVYDCDRSQPADAVVPASSGSQRPSTETPAVESATHE